MKKLLTALGISLLLVMPSTAQDVTEVPTEVPTESPPLSVNIDDSVSVEPEPDTIVDLQLDLIEDTAEVGSTTDFAGALIALGIFMPSAVGLMTLLTSVVKYFVPAIPADKTNLVLSVALIGFFSFVKFTNVDMVALDKTLESITVIGYSILTIAGTGIVSPKLYRASKEAKIPVIGFSKTE